MAVGDGLGSAQPVVLVKVDLASGAKVDIELVGLTVGYVLWLAGGLVGRSEEGGQTAETKVAVSNISAAVGDVLK